MPESPKPIGYWLKRLDLLIEDHFVQTLAVDRLDRRQWQLLNTLATAPAGREHLEMAVAPFLANDPDGAARALAALIERGWAEEDDRRIAMTLAGAEAHRRIRQRVAESRRQILDGVTPEQYQAVLTTLEQMANNLGGSAPEQPGSPSRCGHPLLPAARRPTSDVRAGRAPAPRDPPRSTGGRDDQSNQTSRP